MNKKLTFSALAALSMMSAASTFAEDATREDERQAFNRQEREQDRAMLRDRGTTTREHPELAAKLLQASDVYTKLIEDKTAAVPDRLLKESGCVAVIPGVRRTAFILGSTSGSGAMSCKTSTGRWSAPSFVSLSGKSLGAQLGTQASDVVLYLVGDRAVAKFLDEEDIRLGRGINIGAGPVGMDANLPLSEGALSYLRNESGMFAGASLQDAKLKIDDDANEELYGKDYSGKDILRDQKVESMPQVAQQFISALQKRQV